MALIEHKILGDHRGKLVALESGINIPFEIKRVFYIYGTQESVPRGQHAHHATKQYLIAINGNCLVTLDNGSKKEIFQLSSPNFGLFQDAMVWGEMHDFSPDCVLLVLASDYYDEGDYIRNYHDFLGLIK